MAMAEPQWYMADRYAAGRDRSGRCRGRWTYFGGALTGTLRSAVDELGALLVGEDPLLTSGDVAAVEMAGPHLHPRRNPPPGSFGARETNPIALELARKTSNKSQSTPCQGLSTRKTTFGAAVRTSS
jgi:hypothetical protein